MLRDLADAGVAILMISSDMEEVIGVSDRVAVMHEGAIMGILGRESYNYTPTEGRNTTGYLSPEVKTPSSFGAVATSSGLT